MANNLAGLFNDLKRNPDGAYYKKIVSLLEFRLDNTKTQLVKATDTEEIFRLQGKALELGELLKGLTRKPLIEQHTGGFSG